jgi:DNA replication and repair protein RecF
MLSSLHLRNFRSHSDFSLDCDSKNVVISGENGVGKTNILEAISMLSAGKGFRGASTLEQLRHEAGQIADFWFIQADLELEKSHKLVTGFDPKNSSKRIIKIDGEVSARQAELLQYLHVIWFLPTQSHLFLSPSSERRKYFDRIVYGFDANHANLINAYEHYVRERSKLFKIPNYDSGWADALEAKIADYSLQIAKKRAHALNKITSAMNQIPNIFPKAQLKLNGDVEDLLSNNLSDEFIKEAIIAKLQQNRFHDARSGRCSVGAHKTKLEVNYIDKQMPAELCSTGEQKALLISILIAQINCLIEYKTNHQAIILLLDEAAAHLDRWRRAALFELIDKAGVQLFATATEAEIFAELPNILHVKL